MSMTDPIADLITRIRNANTARLEKLRAPASNMKLRVLTIMRDEGYIKNFKVEKEGEFDTIIVSLRYLENQRPVIEGLKRISRPGLRQYVKHDKIPKVRGGMGMSILSTSQGVMSDREARERKIGGELICTIW